jgi:hypothetical protein
LPLFKNYKNQEYFSVTVEAVIFVPGRILIGLVSTQAETEDEIPYFTIAIGWKWTEFFSKNVVEVTCNGQFKDSYSNLGTLSVQVARNL